MEHEPTYTYSKNKRSGLILRVVSTIMIVFGLAEVVTSFTHQFFGLSTADNQLAIILGVTLGIFYICGGLLLLTQKTWAAIVVLVLLSGDIIGRIAMVVLKLYSIDSFRQGFGIITGTLIALVFTIYIVFNLASFRRS